MQTKTGVLRVQIEHKNACRQMVYYSAAADRLLQLLLYVVAVVGGDPIKR